MNHISHSIERALDDMLESAQLTDINLSEELEPIQMASETLGRDLLQGCLQEVRNLPEVWPKLSEHRQADVIERLTARISSSVKMAVRILAADNRPTIDGILESVAVKDGIKPGVQGRPLPQDRLTPPAALPGRHRGREILPMSTEECAEPDKLTEQQMADLLGVSKRALEARRARKQIPEGVWNRLGRRIIYSRKRYDEWLESQWVCPPGWRSEAIQSASVLRGTEGAAPKRSITLPRKRGSRLHPVFEIK